MSEIEFINKFNRKGILTKSNEYIVYKKYCKEFINAISEHEFAIIGIDGFSIDNADIFQPNIDEIADFSELLKTSWKNFRKESIDSAKKFINNIISHGKSNGFSFVLYSQEEYNQE